MGYGFVLGGLLLVAAGSGCRGASGLRSAERLDRGYTLVLPGILGRCPWDHNVAKGLADANTDTAIEIHDWTKGPLLFPYNARSKELKRQQAKMIAQKIIDYQDRYPGRPVHLVGHSGGCSMAVLALEELPPSRKVSQTVLLASGLAPKYDLSTAMDRTEGEIHNFYSHYDVPISVVFTSALGTMEGHHTIASGAVGFKVPEGLAEDERSRYESKLKQHPFRWGMLKNGHPGGHFGWTNPAFVRKWVVPLVDTPAGENPLEQPETMTVVSHARRPIRDSRTATRRGASPNGTDSNIARIRDSRTLTGSGVDSGFDADSDFEMDSESDADADSQPELVQRVLITDRVEKRLRR
jgi:hypothetical protein